MEQLDENDEIEIKNEPIDSTTRHSGGEYENTSLLEMKHGILLDDDFLPKQLIITEVKL